jgi:hypothetical protein
MELNDNFTGIGGNVFRFGSINTVTQLPVHPASPVVLTKNRPLGAPDSMA